MPTLGKMHSEAINWVVEDPTTVAAQLCQGCLRTRAILFDLSGYGFESMSTAGNGWGMGRGDFGLRMPCQGVYVQHGMEATLPPRWQCKECVPRTKNGRWLLL
jgi:hypothetical protein